jgi:hypothetical protein
MGRNFSAAPRSVEEITRESVAILRSVGRMLSSALNQLCPVRAHIERVTLRRRGLADSQGYVLDCDPTHGPDCRPSSCLYGSTA